MSTLTVSKEAEVAHALIRALRTSAMKAARQSPQRTAKSATRVPGLGIVAILCWREPVVRAYGETERNRFRFFLDGDVVREATIYAAARAL